jgi:molybdenum cofactor synthesis domain-containing protein
MCGLQKNGSNKGEKARRKIPVNEAVGLKLAHDITEIQPGEFKCRAYKKGHVIRQDDIEYFLRLGKEHVFVLNIKPYEMHEDEAAQCLADALMGEGVAAASEPKEGKINIIAARDGLLKVNKESLLQFNMLGSIMCATLHDNTRVKKGRIVAGTRAIPLVVNRTVVDEAAALTERLGKALKVKDIRKPKAGIVITGNEVYHGRIKDAFAPVIVKKVREYNGEIVGLYFAPDDEGVIRQRLVELIEGGADLLITTGGMSIDPDDVTRFAVRSLGVDQITYGSAVLPGAMFLLAYLNRRTSDNIQIPVLGVPACAIHHKTTAFDLILPRILAGERIGRKELAELGHGGLCLNCAECHYPVCPFGKE